MTLSAFIYEIGESLKEPVMRYEGDSLPTGVPVVRWEDYRLEEERPDIIFIHNPEPTAFYMERACREVGQMGVQEEYSLPGQLLSPFFRHLHRPGILFDDSIHLWGAKRYQLFRWISIRLIDLLDKIDRSGDYRAAFSCSDAMITTYSSMINEYMATGKPIMIFQSSGIPTGLEMPFTTASIFGVTWPKGSKMQIRSSYSQDLPRQSINLTGILRKSYSGLFKMSFISCS